MSVNLSPVGGAAAQFFDNNGNPLSGGKLYTYAAGTTTPLAAYTTSAGDVAHTNPIILDSAGRVPSGEIWLAQGLEYKFMLHNSADVLIATFDNIPSINDQTALIAYQNLIASSSGSSFVGYLPAGVGAVATTVQDLIRKAYAISITAFDNTVDTTGATNASVKIQACIDATSGYVKLVGTPLITSQLIVRGNCCGLVGEGMYLTTLIKGFSGNAIAVLNSGAVLTDFGILGNGATHTGGGVNPQGYNVNLSMLRITDTADSCVIFSPAIGTNVGTGTYCTVQDCFLLTTNTATTFTIRSTGTDDSARPTDRKFIRISGGGSGPDFTGMNLARFDASLVTSVKFGATSQKIYMGGGNRITSAASGITIFGVDHVIDDTLWGFTGSNTVTIDATCTNVVFGPCNNISNASFGVSVAQNIAIGAANPNRVFTQLQSNTVLPWLASTTNPTIGNGSFTNFYRQDGRLCTVQFAVVVGSTTSVGAGTYSFQLPFKAQVDSFGTALVKSSSGTFYPATFNISGSSSLGFLFLSGGFTSVFTSTAIALGSNATIQIQAAYPIALS